MRGVPTAVTSGKIPIRHLFTDLLTNPKTGVSG